MWRLACFAAAACAVLSHELGIVILPLLLLLLFNTEQQRSRNLFITLDHLSRRFRVEALRLGVGVKSFSALASVKWRARAWKYWSHALYTAHER